jgi:hypothetical protein
MGTSPRKNALRKRITATIVALVLVVIAVAAVSLRNEGKGEMSVRFVKFETNAAGLRECVYIFENKAWDCVVVKPSVLVCTDPAAVAKANRQIDNQGRRIWLRMKLRSETNITVATPGEVVLRSEKAIWRFAEPADEPWTLHVECIRTNIPTAARVFSDINKAAHERFKFPRWVRLEEYRVIGVELMTDDERGPVPHRVLHEYFSREAPDLKILEFE